MNNEPENQSLKRQLTEAERMVALGKLIDELNIVDTEIKNNADEIYRPIAPKFGEIHNRTPRRKGVPAKDIWLAVLIPLYFLGLPMWANDISATLIIFVIAVAALLTLHYDSYD